MNGTWYLAATGAGASAENMAFDEAMLEWVNEFGCPILRFYGWIEPAATFGYFQKYAEIAQATHLRPLIRRPTGGGLVPHDADWTYSLAFPVRHPWYELHARASYERVHAWIQAAFTRLGVPTQLSPSTYHILPGQCFAGAEQFDVLWSQRKIAGAAQRRNRQGLLIQGSIQPPGPTMDRPAWERTFCEYACESWKASWQPFPQSEPFARRVRELTEQKYSNPAFNERR